MKTYFRYLSSNKLFSVVNIAGLSISLMFVLLIANLTMRQLTIDSNQPDLDRTYLLANENSVAGHYRYGIELESRIPTIKEWCAVSNRYHPVVSYDDRSAEMKAYLVKKNFFEFFSGFKILEGTAKTALVGNDNAVLTRKGAIKMFGSVGEAMGKVISHGERRITVTAVVDDIDNSIFLDDTEMFIPYEQMGDFNQSAVIEDTNMGNAACATLFFRFTEGTNPNADDDALTQMMREFSWVYQKNADTHAFFMPMKELHFSSDKTTMDLSTYDFTIILVFIIAGIIILVMAVLNYVSMSVAQTAYRAKEMATRRLLGSPKEHIFWRMISESAIMVCMSFAIAMLLALAVEPYAADLVQQRLDIAGDASPLYVAICLLFILLLSLISGIMPASILSSYHPLDVVKGNFRRKTKSMWLRVLCCLQSGLCIGLLSCAGYLGVKLHRVLHTPLGYTYGNVLIYPGSDALKGMQSFRDEALKLPFVKNVSLSMGTPLSAGNNMTCFYQDGDSTVGISFRVFKADSAFFDIYHIRMLEDNHSCPVFLSEQAIKETQPITHEGCTRGDGWGFNFGGTFKDFTVRSVLDYGGKPQPIIIVLEKKNEIWAWNISVEVGEGDLISYRKTLDKLYGEMTKMPVFDSKWYDDMMMTQYATYISVEKVMVIFTLVALLISLLGLTAMNIFFITQRKRDIAVRKAFGASALTEQIILVRLSLISVCLSLIIAVPLMLLGFGQIDKLLLFEGAFPFWIPVAAFLTVALVTAVSVMLISHKAVNENPIQNLKTE